MAQPEMERLKEACRVADAEVEQARQQFAGDDASKKRLRAAMRARRQVDLDLVEVFLGVRELPGE